jgi:hypothetical protein
MGMGMGMDIGMVGRVELGMVGSRMDNVEEDKLVVVVDGTDCFVDLGIACGIGWQGGFACCSTGMWHSATGHLFGGGDVLFRLLEVGPSGGFLAWCC